MIITPTMLIIPVKNCDRAIRIPFSNCSVSVITLLIISPFGFLSIYEIGSNSIFWNASFRISFITEYVTLLFVRFIIYEDILDISIKLPIINKLVINLSKLTLFLPII